MAYGKNVNMFRKEIYINTEIPEQAELKAYLENYDKRYFSSGNRFILDKLIQIMEIEKKLSISTNNKEILNLENSEYYQDKNKINKKG